MPGRSHEPTAVRLVVEPHPSEELRRTVSERLDLFNVAATGLDEWHEVAVLLRDRDDEIVGGVLGDTWGGWLHITYLWVAPAYRGRGHGRALVRAAERFAAERGCTHARLETYSFQAPGLYAKLGYEVFGVLDDYPPGHKQYFLARALGSATRRVARSRPGQSQPRKKSR